MKEKTAQYNVLEPQEYTPDWYIPPTIEPEVTATLLIEDIPTNIIQLRPNRVSQASLVSSVK